MTNNILEITNLNKSYSNFSINNINLAIKEKDVLGIIGPNGAGKSTLIKSILNIIKIDSGTIKFKNKDIKNQDDKFKMLIGYVGDTSKFYNDIKLNNIYKFVKDSYKDKWDDEYFHTLISNKFNLDLQKTPKELSTGMLVKFIIALALAHKCELLILDEPTSGLDPIIREELLNILYDLNKHNNVTILMSSHILDDIESICNRIIFIDSGNILLDIRKDDIKTTFAKISKEDLPQDKVNLFKQFSIENKNNFLFSIDSLNMYIKNRDDLLPYFTEMTLNEILILLRKQVIV